MAPVAPQTAAPVRMIHGRAYLPVAPGEPVAHGCLFEPAQHPRVFMPVRQDGTLPKMLLGQPGTYYKPVATA